MQAASEPYSTLYLAAALTGMRQGELIGPKWQTWTSIGNSFTSGVLSGGGKLQSTKSEASMRVPHMLEHLAVRLKEHLQSWRPNPGGFLFASRVGTPLHPHHLVARRLQPLATLGIERAGMHAFRNSQPAR